MSLGGNLLNPAAPRWIFLQLLENCNLRCRMCYEWGDSGAYKNTRLKRLKLDQVLGIIDDFKAERPYYELFGGEPLLYPRVERVFAAIRDAGSQVHFPTNGTLLAEHAEMLVETQPHRVWVSLDGPPAVNDAQRGLGVFEQAVGGIETLHERRMAKGGRTPQIGVSTVVTPGNQHAIADLYLNQLDLDHIDCISIELQAYMTPAEHGEYEDFLRSSWDISGAPIASGFVCEQHSFAEMDAAHIADQIAQIEKAAAARGIYVNKYPKIATPENIENYFRGNWREMAGLKKRCPFPWISAEVSARGEVTTCHAFYDLSMGNIAEQSLRDIWNGERYGKFRSEMRKGLLPICHACCLYYNERPPYQAQEAQYAAQD